MHRAFALSQRNISARLALIHSDEKFNREKYVVNDDFFNNRKLITLTITRIYLFPTSKYYAHIFVPSTVMLHRVAGFHQKFFPASVC